MTQLAIIFATLFYSPGAPPLEAEESLWAVARRHTPVYDARNFPDMLGLSPFLNGDRLFLNHVFTALPGSVFKVVFRTKQSGQEIFKVTTKEYLCTSGCWVDARFVRLTRSEPAQRKRAMPAASVVLKRLFRMADQKVPYCWGCNHSEGIPENLRLYGRDAQKRRRHVWLMRGVDCSGMLYEATGGVTPRDTHQLLSYGKPVRVQGRNHLEVLKRLRPLDIIVWYGHVVIVLTKDVAVEAINKVRKVRIQQVRRLSLKLRLWEIMRKQKPVNDYHLHPAPLRKKFVVRRWHPEMLQ